VVSNDHADWARRHRPVAPARTEPTAWPIPAPLVFTTDLVFTAPADSELAGTACLFCDRAIADLPFQVWTVVSCLPCDLPASHLPSVSALLHVRCAGITVNEIARLIIAQSQACFTL
jgi:hypothetical protein